MTEKKFSGDSLSSQVGMEDKMKKLGRRDFDDAVKLFRDKKLSDAERIICDTIAVAYSLIEKMNGETYKRFCEIRKRRKQR